MIFLFNGMVTQRKNLPPTPIKSIDDFKRVIKMISSIGESEINKRLEELKNLGLELSVASKVFKVVVTGTSDRLHKRSMPSLTYRYCHQA